MPSVLVGKLLIPKKDSWKLNIWDSKEFEPLSKKHDIKLPLEKIGQAFKGVIDNKDLRENANSLIFMVLTLTLTLS